MAISTSKLSPAVGRRELMPDGTDRALRALVHNLLRFSERLVDLRSRFASLLGMSREQYTVLTGIVYLQAAEGASLPAVAAHLQLDPSFVSTEAGKLVGAGVLEWSENNTHVQLSPYGIDLLNDLARIQAPVDDALFRKLSAEQFEQLHDVVAGLISNADDARTQCGVIEAMATLLPSIQTDVETTKINTKAFRNALGQFATGVTIVTAEVAGRRIGMTMNSFNSVSLDPPLVLFSVAKTARSLRDLKSAAHYAVNVLRADQHEFSELFAKTLADKWSGVPVKRGRSGCLMLEQSLATFECTPYASHDGGDHVIFIGRVLHLEVGQHAEPLLYYRGAYASVASVTHSAANQSSAHRKSQDGIK